MTMIGYNLAATTTSATHAVGERFRDESTGKEYIYVKGSAAISQYNAVWVKSTYSAAPLSDTLAKSGGIFAVAPIAFAANDYGWVQTEGKCTVSVLSACAANKQLFTSATAGALDDATNSTSQLQVQGIVLTSAESASAAPAVLHNPVIRRLEI